MDVMILQHTHTAFESEHLSRCKEGDGCQQVRFQERRLRAGLPIDSKVYGRDDRIGFRCFTR